MATVTKPVALNESLNTTDSTPKNIADVLKDKLGDIASAISGGGGGSGGHTIQNASGVNMPQENTMQFTDSHVSDDSTNEKTVIENIKSVTEAQFESATEDGLYDVDVEGAEIGEISEDYVEVTADGVKTYGQLLNELYTSIDYSKITYNSKIQDNLYVYNISRYPSNSLVFTCTRKENEFAYRITVFQLSSSSTVDEYRNHTTAGMTATSYTDTVPTSGTKITLYYGNDKAVVDLQTTANRCLYDSNTTVKQKLDEIQVISTTMPALNTQKFIDLPTGFIRSNTFILSIMVDYSNGTYNMLTREKFSCDILGNRLVLWHNAESTFVDAPVRIMLKKQS